MTVRLSETAKMLSAIVTQEEANKLRRVVGTARVGDVLGDIMRHHGLRHTLMVSSALVELAIRKER